MPRRGGAVRPRARGPRFHMRYAPKVEMQEDYDKVMERDAVIGGGG